MPPPVPILDDAQRSKENRLLGVAQNRPNSLFLAANLARRLPFTIRFSDAGEYPPGHPFMADTAAAPRIAMGHARPTQALSVMRLAAYRVGAR
jgi:hypothetical protein